jgi:hypothetical protein
MRSGYLVALAAAGLSLCGCINDKGAVSDGADTSGGDYDAGYAAGYAKAVEDLEALVAAEVAEQLADYATVAYVDEQDQVLVATIPDTAGLEKQLSDHEGRLAALEDGAATVEDLADYALTSDVEEQIAALSEEGGAIDELDARLVAVEGSYASVTYVDAEVAAASVDGLSTYLSVDTLNDEVIFSGANLFVQSGSGSTDGTVNGLGNLIIGYNADIDAEVETRIGSHNLVIGDEHSWTSYGGLVAGYNNYLGGVCASVAGGINGAATGDYASVTGGTTNEASGHGAAICGGDSNVASGAYASISGGGSGVADGTSAAIAGGLNGTAGYNYSTVLGNSGESTNATYDWAPSFVRPEDL